MYPVQNISILQVKQSPHMIQGTCMSKYIASNQAFFVNFSLFLFIYLIYLLIIFLVVVVEERVKGIPDTLYNN